jgi:hypothetical protein
MKTHMLVFCLVAMLPWLAQADESQDVPCTTPLVRKWVGEEIENFGLAIVAAPVKGDFYHFTFHGAVADKGIAPVLTITFGKNAK